jgi:hypothetical protein
MPLLPVDLSAHALEEASDFRDVAFCSGFRGTFRTASRTGFPALDEISIGVNGGEREREIRSHKVHHAFSRKDHCRFFFVVRHVS